MIPLLIKAVSGAAGGKKETSKISNKVKEKQPTQTAPKTTPKQKETKEVKTLDKSKINELAANSSSAAKAVNELSKNIATRQMDDSSGSDKSASSKIRAQQEENRIKAFNAQIIDAMDIVAKSQETIATTVEDANEKVQTDEPETKPAAEEKSFIGKAVEGISKNMSEGGNLSSMITMGIMAIVGGLVSWWTASGGPGDVGILTWLWTTVSEGASKLWGIISDAVAENGGWWETIKDALYLGLLGVSKVVQFQAWVIDSAMTALFGDGWQSVKDAFSEKWKAVSAWWDEVSSMGIGSWIYKQLYDALGGRIGGETFGIDLPEPKASVAKTDIKVKSQEPEEEEKPKPVPGTPKYKTKKQEAFYNVAMKLPPKERAAWIKKYDDDMNVIGENNNVNNVSNVKNKSSNISKSLVNKVNNNVSNVKNSSKVTNNKKDVSKYNVNKQQTNIKAVANGTVENFQTSNKTKTIAVTNEDGTKTIYNNVDATIVKPGQKIVAGDNIATTTNTSSNNSVTVKNNSKTMNKTNNVNNSGGNSTNTTKANTNNTNIESSTVEKKTINIKRAPKPEQSESGMTIGELTYMDDMFKAQAKQISKLSSSSNTGTLLQTKVSV